MRNPQKKLSTNETEELIGILKARFVKHMNSHKGIAWDKVQARLEALSSAPAARAGKLWSLHQMEATGGEPDVVGYDKNKDLFLFVDCSAESPKGRRSLCYDRDALDARKEYKPRDSAVDMAASMGITLLTEDDYRQLQRLGRRAAAGLILCRWQRTVETGSRATETCRVSPREWGERFSSCC